MDSLELESMSKRSANEAAIGDTTVKRNKTQDTSSAVASMSTSRAKKRILVVGLAGHAPGSAKPPTPRGGFKKMLQDTTSEAERLGLKLEMMQIKATAFPAGLESIKEKLSSKPHGLVIGNGIRGTDAYTVFFEDLVSAARETSPSTRLAFNTSPSDILECCRRNFT